MPGCKGSAHSRRAAESVNTAPLHYTNGMIGRPLPLRCLAFIYEYIHFVSRSDVFACVCVPRIASLCVCCTRSLVCVTLLQGSQRHGCLMLCNRNSLSLPQAFSCCVCYLAVVPLGPITRSPTFIFFSIVMPSTRFLCGCVVWCDLLSGAAAAALRRNAAPEERCSARACGRAY
jgi:hypothetical protein